MANPNSNIGYGGHDTTTHAKLDVLIEEQRETHSKLDKLIEGQDRLMKGQQVMDAKLTMILEEARKTNHKLDTLIDLMGGFCKGITEKLDRIEQKVSA